VKAVFGLGLLMVLTACGGPPPVLFDGMKITAKVSATSDDKRDFDVVVRDAADKAGPAARAARYEATQYCLKRFAGSDVVWADGVLQDAKTLITADGSLVRQGRCVQR
jgi:hypothetical protein